MSAQAVHAKPLTAVTFSRQDGYWMSGGTVIGVAACPRTEKDAFRDIGKSLAWKKRMPDGSIVTTKREYAPGKSPLLSWSPSGHMAVISGSGGAPVLGSHEKPQPAWGGKTTSDVFDDMLTWVSSLVVIDPKGEILRTTGGFRRNELGHKVFWLTNDCDESDLLPWSHSTDVTSWVRLDRALVDDCLDLSAWAVPKNPDSKEPFFDNSARDLFAISAVNVFYRFRYYGRENGERRPTIAHIVAPFFSGAEGVMKYIGQISAFVKEEREKVSDKKSQQYEALYAFQKLADKYLGSDMEKTFPGIVDTLTSSIGPWAISPSMLAVISGGTDRTFDMSEILDGKTSLYLTFPADVLQGRPAIVRMVIGGVLKTIRNAKTKMAKNGNCLFVLDEVQQILPMDELQKNLPLMRGYGAIFKYIIQSIGDYNKACGDDKAAYSLMANCHIVKMFAIRDADTAELASKMTGDATIVGSSLQDSGSGQTQGGQMFGSMGVQRQQGSLQARPLMKPSEILTMPAWLQLVFTSGQPPLLCGRATYFLREEFQEINSGWLEDQGRKPAPASEDQEYYDAHKCEPQDLPTYDLSDANDKPKDDKGSGGGRPVERDGERQRVAAPRRNQNEQRGNDLDGGGGRAEMMRQRGWQLRDTEDMTGEAGSHRQQSAHPKFPGNSPVASGAEQRRADKDGPGNFRV